MRVFNSSVTDRRTELERAPGSPLVAPVLVDAAMLRLLRVIVHLLYAMSVALASEIDETTHQAPVSYYVSCSAGNDTNDGLSAQTPWQR